MTEEEYETFKQTIQEIKDIYKHIPEDNIRECLKMYISRHRKHTREDLLHFVRVNINLHNL